MAEKQALAFFESMCEAHQRAGRAAGGFIDRYFAIGGYTVRLQFAGPALVPFITPALEHLAIPPARDSVDLTICLWDSVSTRVQMPARPWDWDKLCVRGEVKDFNDARIHTALNADSGVLSVLDQDSHRAVFWIRDPRHLPTYERGAPLRIIFYWWMRAHHRQLVHAGAVERSDWGKGVLIVGKGGSGKSTTALACLAHGWRYAADDYCLLGLNGGLAVYSLYNSAKLDPRHLQNFPGLVPAISNPEELTHEKALLFLAQHQPTRLVPQLSVRAIVLPRVTGGAETTWSPAARAGALKALAPSSIFQNPGAGRDDFLTLARFTQAAPCYSLELGTEVDRIPEALSEVLGE